MHAQHGNFEKCVLFVVKEIEHLKVNQKRKIEHLAQSTSKYMVVTFWESVNLNL